MTDQSRAQGDDHGPSVDSAEIGKFAAISDEWWDPTGKFKPLHKLNPVRLAYIRDQACHRFDRDARANRPLDGLRLLDIGCGGGLLSEPMARLGADVMGADAALKNIRVAQHHANEQGLVIDYGCATAETLAAAGEKFDIILNMEVIEHVADIRVFLSSCAAMLKPHGLMVISSINRTPKAFVLAIVGAEYVLGWLPKGSHDYAKLVRPDEIVAALDGSGLDLSAPVGVGYNLWRDAWQLTSDTSVNYMLYATRPL